MKYRRFIGPALRLSSLCAVLAGVLVLMYWSRIDDPRFYRFLHTAPGQFLARTFRWYGAVPDVPAAEKPESRMSRKERAVKARLVEELRKSMPTHRLVFRGGESMTGWVLEERPGEVLFTETYGSSGSLFMKVGRRRILRIEPLTNAPPAVTYRDVRFQMEFERMSLYQRPPYTVLTDEDFFRVEKYVQALQDLHAQFVRAFGPLLVHASRGDGIQVLFFSDEDPYRSYQAKYAPRMADSSGFYSPWVDRLVVFDQNASDRIRRLRAKVQAEEERVRQSRLGAEANERAAAWRAEMERDIARFAEAQTLAALRHEGAHQLLFTYGVHSENRMENEWLVEGLASYCESPRLGDREPVRAAVLRKAAAIGGLMPLADLVNLRSRDGLQALGSADRVELGYDQAWGLVDFLMQEDRRPRFFAYVEYVRDPRNFREVRGMAAMDLLCRFLETTPAGLRAQWEEYVARL